MTKKLCVLVAACAVGGLATGCGSSSSSSTTGTTTPPAATTSSTGSTTPTTPTTTSTTGSGLTSAQVKAAEAANPALAKAVTEAVAQCKATIKAQPTLTGADKSKLYTICDEAATGNQAAVRKAAADVCQQVIKDTVPATSRAQALASCPKQ